MQRNTLLELVQTAVTVVGEADTEMNHMVLNPMTVDTIASLIMTASVLHMTGLEAEETTKVKTRKNLKKNQEPKEATVRLVHELQALNEMPRLLLLSLVNRPRVYLILMILPLLLPQIRLPTSLTPLLPEDLANPQMVVFQVGDLRKRMLLETLVVLQPRLRLVTRLLLVIPSKQLHLQTISLIQGGLVLLRNHKTTFSVQVKLHQQIKQIFGQIFKEAATLNLYSINNSQHQQKLLKNLPQLQAMMIPGIRPNTFMT
jgi:hypothetical protein